MGADEFWHGEPRLAKAYRDADALKTERLYVSEWRAGLYVYEALAAASGLYREFSKGADAEYPRAPLFGAHSEDAKAEEAMEAGIAAFASMAAAANRAFAAQGEEPPLEQGGENGRGHD